MNISKRHYVSNMEIKRIGHQEKHLRHAGNYMRVLSVCMDPCYPTHIMLQRGQESFFKTNKDKKAQL